jgi:hypothetical protein
MITDFNPRENYRTGPNPDIVADGNGLIDDRLVDDVRAVIVGILVCLRINDDPGCHCAIRTHG